ncbi:MAG: tetratricopeptide repeat protein [Candidatus Gastranaerophilaceae bacterium]|nr:tetratricopeptide repeat protein [Candidatus Gastranaerophilaceae bacterium]
MGLNLSNIQQRPYTIRDGYVKRKKDEDGSNAAQQTQREEQASQNGRSRGLQYIDNGSDQFTRNNAPVDGQPWQKQMYNNVQSQAPKYAAPQYNAAPRYSVPVLPEEPVSKFANVNTSINIAQILKDFKNTAVAIGTPDELKEEVNGYIELIEKQVTKDEPNKKLIKSNLKNASTILDNYISETLNKDSKVVENWVDALFMQDIDFKYNEEDVNPQFLVKFPEGSTESPEQTQSVQIAEEVIETPVAEEVIKTEVSEQPKVHIPEDAQLKSLFIQSKKLAYAKEPKKAIENFQKALSRAEEVGDTETKSKIFYEIGKIYDDYNYPAQALKSYHKSIQNTTDTNVKTRAHYSMAQIYDDVNQIEPALDHYFVSVAYGGESDNRAAQSTSLAKMGNIFSDMYEEDAFEYLTTARDLAAETDNSKVKGFVSASLGRAYERFGEPQEALKSYSEAVKNYSDAESPVKAAQNYLSAADIMLDFNSKNKARGLLNKAHQFAQEANDEILLEEINNRLAQIA